MIFVFPFTWCQPSLGMSPSSRCPPHSKAPQEPETTKFWIRSLWKEKSVLELDTWHQMALWIRITLIPPPTLWSFHQWRPRFVPRQHQVLDQGIYTWKITYINWYTVIYTWRRNKIFTNHEDITINWLSTQREENMNMFTDCCTGSWLCFYLQPVSR